MQDSKGKEAFTLFQRRGVSVAVNMNQFGVRVTQITRDK